MQDIEYAQLQVYWDFPSLADPEGIPVQFNPTELTFNKGAQIAEVAIPGLDSPLLQFVRGQNEQLTFDLFFDTTEDGTDAQAVSVATLTDRIYQLVKIRPDHHSPPVCDFVWGGHGFPGNFTSDAIGGNQRRHHFRCIVESVKQRFTLFSTQGVPLRAMLTVTLREFKTLDEQMAALNLNSPDRTKSHVLARGETLSSVAERHYLRPSKWRKIAETNRIEDPRRLQPGYVLELPLLAGGSGS